VSNNPQKTESHLVWGLRIHRGLCRTKNPSDYQTAPSAERGRALIDDQNTVWQETLGWANIEQKIPARPDTVYKLWSIAKAFTAIETMRLVEEGWVDLNAPVTEYIPDFSIQSRFADSKPITVRSILTHRSGLPRNSCYPSVPGAGDDTLLEKMALSMKHGYPVLPMPMCLTDFKHISICSQ
jgi:CubicO group peptidase (beta-lactamase class C family)